MGYSESYQYDAGNHLCRMVDRNIVTNDDMVVLAKNNQKPSQADVKAYQIFGQGNITIVYGTTSTHYKIGDIVLKEGGEISHAEARAVQAVKDHGGNLQDAREVCSHLSCESCDEIMRIEGGYNKTGVADPKTRGQKTKPSRYYRPYVDNL